MRFCVSAILATGIIVLMLIAGCADVTAKQKVGDFGTAFGATADEQKAIEWFRATYGDPTTNNSDPARFVEPLVTTGISDKNLPVDKVTTFPVAGGSVYFFVIYDNFRKGDPISVNWTYLENNREVTSVQQQAGGDFGRFIVEFQKPDSGWGKGKQRITVTGDGATASADFAIGDSIQTTPLPYNPSGEQGEAAGTTTQTTGQPASGTPACAAGTTLCNNRCLDLNNNDNNCGSCGKKCPSNDFCSNSRCCHYGKVSTGLGWDVSSFLCESGESGKYTVVTTPPITTETTRLPDVGGKTMAGSEKQVADTVAKGQVTMRAVSCNPGETTCSGKCVDLKTDLNNCGSCGNLCGPYPHMILACDDGLCHIPGCNEGYASCDNYAKNGCEVNIYTNPANCGACRHKCGDDQTCNRGVCS